MTEQELRQKVASIMRGWEGATRGSQRHLDILNTYNLHSPLARGYAVKTKDAWCATAVSAAWIAAGIADWTGTECSCGELIKIAQSKGYWVENDAYVPQIGDAVLYDWDDGADFSTTDNTGAPEHIGIVTQIGMGAFVVTEGNMGKESKCGRRALIVNARYIRGFICPDYAAIAISLTGNEEKKVERYNKVSEIPEWARNDIKSLIDKGIIRGGGGVKDADGRPADLDLSYDMLRLLVMVKRMRG